MMAKILNNMFQKKYQNFCFALPSLDYNMQRNSSDIFYKIKSSIYQTTK